MNVGGFSSFYKVVSCHQFLSFFAVGCSHYFEGPGCSENFLKSPGTCGVKSFKGSYDWRDPFFISMIMGEER